MIVLTRMVREQREHKLFRALLNTVPNLEERIMNGSQEDTKHVADLVGPFNDMSNFFQLTVVRFTTATEGCLKCQVRRYQKYEKCNNRLDNTPWAISGSHHCP